MGYDAAKKVKGRKRHAVVDTLGLMLGCAILPGNVQDRDGCLGILKEVRRLFPFLERVIADGAYQGRATARAVRRAARARLEIVNARMPQRALWCSRSAGLWSARLAGWGAAVVWPRTSRGSRAPIWPLFNWR